MRIRLGQVYLARAEWLFRRNGEDERHEARRLLQRVLDLHGDRDACRCDEPFRELPARIAALVAAAVEAQGWEADARAELDRRMSGLLDAVAGARRRCADRTQVRLVLEALEPHPSMTNAALLAAVDQAEAALRTLPAGHGAAAGSWPARRLQDGLLRLLEEAELGLHQAMAGLGRPASGGLNAWNAGSLLVETQAGLCVPVNPLVTARRERACILLDHLRHCRNILGFDDRLVPELRFETLIQMARGMADLSLAAERDLLGFKQAFESESYSESNASGSGGEDPLSIADSPPSRAAAR